MNFVIFSHYPFPQRNPNGREKNHCRDQNLDFCEIDKALLQILFFTLDLVLFKISHLQVFDRHKDEQRGEK